MHKIVLMGIVAVLGFGDPLFAASDDKEQVTHRLQEFTQAFNKANSAAISTLFTEKVTFISPFTGQKLTGKAELQKFFEQEFSLLKGKNLVFIQKSITFPSAEKATVQGVSELTDNGNLIRKQARRIELIKQNNFWYIDSIREIEVPPAPTVAFTHLKELDWLVGNWQDIDENVSIIYSTKWDAFKNFLKQKFRMDVYGEKEMEGIQIIGWDPVEKNIRSWVYDSDGGFGTGVWSKEGNSWHVVLNFTLSDGQKGILTNVYTPRDSTSYTYSSIDRKIGDVKLPNIEPVTVVKGG